MRRFERRGVFIRNMDFQLDTRTGQRYRLLPARSRHSLVRQPSYSLNLADKFTSVRKQKDFLHDLYWVSQLYEKDWSPF